MFANIFIDFIYTNNLISEKQAREALSKKVSKVRPAIVAVFEGLITEEQAKHIMSLQISDDMPFGFLAVREGVLTNDQLGIILGRPPRADLQIMQILFDKGIMSMEAVLVQFAAFKSFYSLDDITYDGLVANNAESYVTAIGGIDKGNGLFFHYSTVFIQTYMKCIDRRFSIKKAYAANKIQSDYIITIKCEHRDSLTVGFGFKDEASALNIAGRFIKQKMKAFDDDAVDSIKEFSNTVAGMFIAKVEQSMGLDLDIQVPELQDAKEYESENEFLAMEIVSMDGDCIIFLDESC